MIVPAFSQTFRCYLRNGVMACENLRFDENICFFSLASDQDMCLFILALSLTYYIVGTNRNVCGIMSL